MRWWHPATTFAPSNANHPDLRCSGLLLPHHSVPHGGIVRRRSDRISWYDRKRIPPVLELVYRICQRGLCRAYNFDAMALQCVDQQPLHAAGAPVRRNSGPVPSIGSTAVIWPGDSALMESAALRRQIQLFHLCLPLVDYHLRSTGHPARQPNTVVRQASRLDQFTRNGHSVCSGLWSRGTLVVLYRGATPQATAFLPLYPKADKP